MLDVSVLPSVNAGLNGLSALLLSAGDLAIRLRRIEVHRALMIGASTASALKANPLASSSAIGTGVAPL